MRTHRSGSVRTHDPEIREFEITSGGIVLGDPIGGEHAQGMQREE